MSSEYEEGFAIGYRKGYASVTYKATEEFCKEYFSDYFKEKKMLLRWLSEYEMNIVMHRLFKNSSIDIIDEFLFGNCKFH